jgi:hypothetical protein
VLEVQGGKMKVLAKGNGAKAWSRKVTCTGIGNGGGGCGAKLLVEKPDLFHTYRSCLGETETFVTFECPECKVLTDIDCDVPDGRKLPSYPSWRRRNETETTK